MDRRFEEVEHTADIAVRAYGSDLSQLFRNAAYAMASQLVDVDDVYPHIEVIIELEAEDVELLLVQWLSELLYLGERDHLVFTEFDVLEMTQNELRAVARGGAPGEFHHHIKAVTFSELSIQQIDSEYTVTVVFDV